MKNLLQLIKFPLWKHKWNEVPIKPNKRLKKLKLLNRQKIMQKKQTFLQKWGIYKH